MVKHNSNKDFKSLIHYFLFAKNSSLFYLHFSFRSAAHFSASFGCVPTMEMLTQSQKLPNLDLQDDEGKTPLRKVRNHTLLFFRELIISMCQDD